MSDNRDNYNCAILEKCEDGYNAYELVKDNFSGYYVNQMELRTGKRKIIAKFQSSEIDNILNLFFAKIFWDGLKSKYYL